MTTCKQRAMTTVLAAAVVLMMGPGGARADDAFDFTYVSTTNPMYNNRAHLLNTGVYVEEGQEILLAGSGTIVFGGGYSVKTNYDMGLISPLAVLELRRNYRAGPVPLHFEPMPGAGESVLFGQDRAYMDDDHDRNITCSASSSGYIYIGLMDGYFPDNVGDHSFRLTVTPEPSAACLLGLGGLAVLRRRR